MTQHGGEDFLSPEDASSVLGISRRTLERYVKDGRIQRYKLRMRVLFKRRDVEELHRLMEVPQPDRQEKSS
jgi:excisionase family DNA binding protein